MKRDEFSWEIMGKVGHGRKEGKRRGRSRRIEGGV